MKTMRQIRQEKGARVETLVRLAFVSFIFLAMAVRCSPIQPIPGGHFKVQDIRGAAKYQALKALAEK